MFRVILILIIVAFCNFKSLCQEVNTIELTYEKAEKIFREELSVLKELDTVEFDLDYSTKAIEDSNDFNFYAQEVNFLEKRKSLLHDELKILLSKKDIIIDRILKINSDNKNRIFLIDDDYPLLCAYLDSRELSPWYEDYYHVVIFSLLCLSIFIKLNSK